jgi:ubiquitin C-terminal hydrolase
MGKSSKKKRRRERERLLRLQHIGITGTPSSSLQPDDGPLLVTTARVEVHHTTPASASADDSHHKLHPPVEKQQKERAPSKPAPSKGGTFGSAASRTRTLPTVSFVFPKRNGQSKAESYQFGKEPKKERHSSTSAQQDTDILHSNRATVKTNQSIDDILFPKARATQLQLELNGTRDDETNGGIKKESAPKVVSMKRSLSDGALKKDPSHQSSVNGNRSSHDAVVPLQHDDDDNVHSHRSPYFSGISVEEAVLDKVGLRPRSNSTDGELKLPQRGLCDERKVLETYQWRNDICKVPPKGFNNLGNTCFLNSTLQCLAYCPPFCQSIMAMPQGDTAVSVSEPIVGSKNKFKNKKDKGGNQGKKITLMLGSLFRQVHGTGDTVHSSSHGSFGGNRTISPRSIVQAVPSLGACSSRNGYKFRPGRQEDAHEFLVHLLDAMNGGELRDAGINAHKSGWRDRLPVPRLDETTFIHRIFGGYLRSQVRCTACGYRSNTYDPFLDLSLEISRKSCHSIESAFQEFTRKETLDTENRWKCSGCKKRVCATKQLTVFRPPLSLCIQLKRFSYGGSFVGFGGRMGGTKISKPIAFPANLKLPLSDGRSCGYSLTGIVIHVGGSASSGHYTAYVKKPGTNGEDKWYHMDDSFVQAVTENDVLRQRDAYVLMYCRKEVKLEFPTPPLRGYMTAEEAKELSRSRARVRADSLTDTLAVVCLASTSETETTPKESSADASTSSSSSRSAESSEQDVTTNPFSGDRARSESSSRAAETDKEPPTAMKNMLIGPLPKNGVKLDPRVQPSSTSSASESSDSDGSGDGETVGAESNKGEKSTKNSSQNATSPTKSESSSSSEEESSSSSEDSSSNSEESDSAGSDDDSDSGGKPTPTSKSAQSSGSSKPVKHAVTRITVDRGEGGKVEVMMGPRYKTKKSWRPKTTEGQKDEGYDLLGNLRVGKWDDDDEYIGKDNGNRKLESLQARTKIAKQMQRVEQDRKRKMFLDRHDALLDQGKVSDNSCWKFLFNFLTNMSYPFSFITTRQAKKVKQNKVHLVQAQTTPNNNVFQRIQSSMQKMNKGRAKGHFQANKISGKRRR